MLSALIVTIVSASISAASAQAVTWGSTKNLFVFGDSYTTTGWNVSAGLLKPAPGYTSSNGPNWVMALTERYNVTNTQVFNLAYGGATIDSALVTPYLPTVQSVVTQVSLWKKYFSPPPSEVPWQSNDSLFAIWIGINDVGNSWGWTNVSQSDFHQTLMNRLFSQVDILYEAGARSFIFINTPPLERTPLFVSQGSSAVSKVRSATNGYNSHLKSNLAKFVAAKNTSALAKNKGPLGQVVLLDSNKIFTTLLKNADIFGFVNVTGFSELYQNGTPDRNTQVSPFKPVSSFFWLNSLHPIFTVHDILAKSILTLIS